MNNSSFLVSIIVPCFNSEKYLDFCLKSIESQTYQNFEVLLIDDNSTDNTYFILQEWSKKDIRFKFFKNNKCGVSSARNFGIKIAKGEYICFVDSDDFIDKNYLKYMLDIAIKSGALMVQCNFREIYESMYPKNCNNYNVISYSMKDSLHHLIHPNDLAVKDYLWNKLYNAKLLEGMSFEEGRYFEDVSYMYKIIKKTDMLISIDCILYYYRRTETSITGDINLKKMSDYFLSFSERYLSLKTLLPKCDLDKAFNSSLKYVSKQCIKNIKKIDYNELSTFLHKITIFMSNNKIKSYNIYLQIILLCRKSFFYKFLSRVSKLLWKK